MPEVSTEDNSACVALLEAKPSGLVWLLEEECNLPTKPTDSSLVGRFFSTHKEHEHLLHPKTSARRPATRRRHSGSAPRFAVAHYAATVVYEVRRAPSSPHALARRSGPSANVA